METDIILSDRVERFRILDFLWKAQRNATERNPDGSDNSPNIAKSLGIEKVRVETHLGTLNDRGFILISSRMTGGMIVKIVGKGTVFVEDFFLELERHVGKSDNAEIKNYVQKTEQENDTIMKHETLMQAMITVQEVFRFGNNLLGKLGFGS
ncbi:MAG: hypothetical protein J4F36_09470 [Nitrosopumilaceae archaeon]|nr:hypothetical protein [Nitrosopumilaceae archaeon]